eukprot:NODE_412_length_7926_cov_1.357608.p2 type:complete len:595 gc:universal NODE_412_length_7926_cov_1.357608:3296-5080(+)
MGDLMGDLILNWKRELSEELEIEKQEAIDNKQGIAVDFVDSSTGLNSRCIIQIKPTNPLIDWTFRNGDIIKLLNLDKSAIVYKVNQKFLYLSFEEELDFVHDKIIKLPNDIMYKRVFKVLDDLHCMANPNALMNICFKSHIPNFRSLQIQFFDQTLNDSQKLAVKKSLQSLDIHFIHGPPGTGKTKTLIEIIKQLFQSRKKILICGPSNISVDNIVERLSKENIPCIRMGHPARLLQTVQDKSLEYIVDNCTHGGEVLSDIKLEIEALLRSVHKAKSGKEKFDIYKEIRSLRKEFNHRERKVVFETIEQHHIHCSTLSNCLNRNLSQQYDCVLVDEAAQCTEPELWLGLAKSSKAIIAGDPYQLPPVIKSKTTGRLSISLMERMLDLKIPQLFTMLTVQYRMNKYINQFPSKHMYQNKLIPDVSCANRIITDYNNIIKSDELKFPVVFYDNLQTCCELEDENGSKYNEAEIDNVCLLLDELLDYEIPAKFIGVIAAYNAQVSRLRSRISNQEIEISTVDGYQGREKEVIIISTVRCNDMHEVGFLSDKRRMNVAVSRAKHLLFIFGDSETMERDRFLKDMVDWASSFDIRYFNA